MLLKLGVMIFGPADEQCINNFEKSSSKYEGSVMIPGLVVDSEENRRGISSI